MTKFSAPQPLAVSIAILAEYHNNEQSNELQQVEPLMENEIQAQELQVIFHRQL